MEHPKLVASYFTIAGKVLPLEGSTVSPFSLRERVEAAAKAGYSGIGLVHDDLMINLDRLGAKEISRILKGNGIDFLEFEVLLDWFADGERRRASDKVRADFWRAAELLSPQHLKIGGDIQGTDWPLAQMVDGFAGVCREASELGVTVTIEIFPTSNIRDLPTASAIVKGAAQKNGGLLLDVWHMTRGGIPYEDFATIPADYIKAIELDDADTEVVGTIMEDTLLRRKLPGEGQFDIPRFLAAVEKTGYKGYYGVEILSDEQRERSVWEAAKRSYDAAISQFDRVA